MLFGISHCAQNDLSERLEERLKTIYYRESTNREFRRYFSLLRKGKVLEKKGNEIRALDFYCTALFKYNPIGTDYYTRPAIIFERLKRYREAIAVCEMHIKLAKHPDAHMDLDAAEERLARLRKKCA